MACFNAIETPAMIRALFFWTFLLLMGVAVRGIAVSSAPVSLRGDEISFDVYGWSIAEGKGMARTDGALTSIRPPFYPFFIGILYYLWGHLPIVVKWGQVFLGTLTVAIIYQLTRALVPQVSAKGVAVLSAFFLANIMAPSRLYAETLYLFWVCLSFWGFAVSWNKPARWKMFLSGMSLGLAALTRAAALPLGCLAPLLFLWRGRNLGKSKKVCLGFSLVLLLGFILPILPWTFRNWQVHHRLVLLTTEPGHTLYYAYFPKGGKIFGVVEETELSRQAAQISNEVDKSEFLKNGVLRAVSQDPARFILRQLPLKIAYFWSPFHWELFGNGSYDGTYVFLFPFFLWGVWGLKRFWKEQLLLWVLMFYPFLLALLFYGSDRLRYPTTPAFLIFAAFGLSCFWGKWNHEIKAMALLCSFAGVNLLLTFNAGWTKHLFRSCLRAIGIW